MPKKVQFTMDEIQAAYDVFHKYYSYDASFWTFLGTTSEAAYMNTRIIPPDSERCWEVSQDAASKVRMLLGPHAHTILKAYEARTK